MTNSDSQSPGDDEGLHGKSNRDRVFRVTWIYLRGWLVILVLFLVAKAATEAYTRVAGVIEPVFESLESSALSVVSTLVILIIGPWVIGKVVERLLAGRLLQKQRDVRAVVKIESRLATELKGDGHRGYRVALVNWPNADNRSLGLVGIERGVGRSRGSPAMPDLYHIDNKSIVFDGIYDSVGTLPYSVAIATGQLLATRRPGILGQLTNPPHDALPVFLAGDRLDLFGRGSLDQDLKFCHAV